MDLIKDKDFITINDASLLFSAFEKYRKQGPIYNDPYATSLICEKVPYISTKKERLLLPSYSEINTNDTIKSLKPITKDEASEVTVLVMIGGINETNLDYVFKDDKETQSIKLSQGESIIYNGSNIELSIKNKPSSDEIFILYLNYVYATGDNAKHVFDRTIRRG